MTSWSFDDHKGYLKRQGFLDMRRIISVSILMLSVFFNFSAFAEDAEELKGLAIVKDAGHLMIGGRQVALWGISPLAGDQQCWREEHAWDCGEQATTALKHLTEGKILRCVEKVKKDGGIIAQCFRRKRGGTQEQDIAQYMVRHGWAMDADEESNWQYEEDQEHARIKRNGIWTSRFQTPEDWSEGVQRYIEYDAAPKMDAPHKDGDNDIDDKAE